MSPRGAGAQAGVQAGAQVRPDGSGFARGGPEPWMGLYYPFIHFRDEGWLKFAAIYWDKIGRIVPNGYQTHDSETVKRLSGELGLIENFSPVSESGSVASDFLTFLRRNEERLRARCSVQLVDTWPEDRYTLTAAPERADPRFGYIFVQKLTVQLRESLLASGLAAPPRTGSQNWLGMHPKLVGVYTAVLADRLAANNRLHPLSAEPMDHLVVDGWSMERLAHVPLDEGRLAPTRPTPTEVQDFFAGLALRLVAPANMQAVPVDKIIQLRTMYRDELTEFQNYAANLAPQLATDYGRVGRDGLRAFVDAEVRKGLVQQSRRLRKHFAALGLETVTGTLHIRVTLPPLAAEVASRLELGAADPVVVTAGVLFGLYQVIRQKRTDVQDEVRSSPSAYLLYTRESLSPAGLHTRIARGLRKLAYGV